jgi:hypothetical protein
MSGQAPPESGKLRWILSGLLCLCTLVALWVTGARVKALKMAARYGDRTPAASVDPTGTSTVSLRREQRVQVAHFTLEFTKADVLRISDGAGTVLVEFAAPRKGDLRRWQELQLVFTEVGPDGAKADVEFKPGSPCFGSGTYRALRQGLQIQFPGRTVTIATWDALKPEATLRFEGPPGNVDVVVGPGTGGETNRIRYRFERAGLELQDLN